MASSCDSFRYSLTWIYPGKYFDLYYKSTPYINNPILTSKSIQAFSPLYIKSSLLQDPMAKKEIIVFGANFKKTPWMEDALAIIHVEEALPLTVIPLKEVVPMPPKKTYGQSYYAQAHQHMLPAPQERLLLKDAPKGSMVVVPKNTKLMHPRPNERIVGVKTNKLGEVTCVKYTNATPRISLDGIHAAPSQVKCIPLREAPKRSAPSSLEREAKHPRMTIVMLEDRVKSLK
jgi:hypothetical protein